MEKEIKTAVKAETFTQTHQAVMVSTLMIGAFFIGMSMMFMMTGSIKTVPVESLIVKPISLTKPMLVQDVEGAQMVSTSDIYSSFALSGYTGVNQPEIGFGSIYYTNYQDTDKSEKSIPLFIKTYRDHYSTMITLKTDAGVKTICLPENIKSGGDIANDENEHIYYIDTNGNSYFDISLKKPTGVDCQKVLTKSLHPYPMLGGEVYSGSPYYMQIKRDYLAQLTVNDNEIIDNPDEWPLTIPSSISPIQIEFQTPTDQNFNQSEGVISVTWQNPDPTGYPIIGQNLCIPEKEIIADPYHVAQQAFYDINGNPYSDVFLTQPIDCDFPTPTCNDTDAMDEFTQGTVSGLDYVGREYSEQDYCVDDSVIELWCMTENEYPYLSASLINCENGCENGACIANKDVVNENIE